MLQLFIEFRPGEGDDHLLGAAEYRSGRARPARPVLSSSVEVPCNHSCEAIAPVRLISIHWGGSAARPDATAFRSRAGFECRQSEATINKRRGKPGASVQTEQSQIYRNSRPPHAKAALILNFLHLRSLHLTVFVGINDGGGDSSVRGVHSSGR